MVGYTSQDGTEWNGSCIKCGTGSIKHGMEVFEYLDLHRSRDSLNALPHYYSYNNNNNIIVRIAIPACIANYLADSPANV